MLRNTLSRIFGREASSGPVKAVSKSLSLETLEAREVPSVTVQTSPGGDLTITGDAGGIIANDQVQMSQLLNGATLIQGMNGTKVNGLDRVIVSFNNNLRVNLGNGDNLLYVPQGNGGVVANNAFVTTGSGKDSIQFYQLTLSNDLFVDTGSGDDGVYLNYVTARALGAAPNSSDHGINVYSRGGSDFVQIYNSTSGLDVSVILDDSTVGAPGGNDTLYMDNVSAADDYWLYGFGGQDSFYLNNVHAHDNLAVFMGDGNDYLKLTNSGAGRITTDGGSGWDKVEYHGVSIPWDHPNVENLSLIP
jgi:hypothetical protein